MITITENLTTVTISVTQGQTGTQDISGKVDKIVGKVYLQRTIQQQKNKTTSYFI
jgi:hypothetical protein